MIEEIELYMGDKKLNPREIKNYICVNDYVCEIVNEAYYKLYPERMPKK